MSIREISTQCHFARLAYENIEKKSAKPTDQAFTSIHSFLSHAANVSKMLKSKGKSVKSIGEVIDISNESLIHERTFRNHLEHYDERLKKWISKFGNGARIGTYNIGPRTMFNSSNTILVSHYDPQSKTFTFVDEDFDLNALNTEVERIHKIVDQWIADL